MNFKPATRQGIKPLACIYGESGNGKTFSALLLARGLVGPNGKIGVVDTEAGRGSLYADVIPGGYQVMELGEPFSPRRYIEAIQAAEDANLDCLVIDSGSHEWEGLGGVLDMAGENEARSGKPGLHCWKTPKMEHQKFVLKLLQSPLAIIICLRAKHKSRQIKNHGKTEIVKDEFASPIQAEDFIFEMMAHAEVLPDHTIRLTKHSHPDLKMCFPEDGKEPLGIKHGQAIAQWCANPCGSPKPDQKEAPKVAKSSKAQLWDIMKREGHSVPDFVIWAVDNEIMKDTEDLSDLSDKRMAEVLEKTKIKLDIP